MREISEPQTRKVFEGEICRVLVELGRNAENRAHVICGVSMLAKDAKAWAVFDPEGFAALVRDLAAVNERVQEFARELVREPVGAVKA